MDLFKPTSSLVYFSFVIVIHVALTSAEITLLPNYDFRQTKILDYKAANTLQCNISGDPNPDYVMKWFRNDKPIEEFMADNKRIELKDNKLIIRRLLDDDIVNYTCILSLKNSPPNSYITKAEIITVGKPTAKLIAPVTVIEGEKLKLECQVTGKPAPVVEWRYEDTKLERGSDRIRLTDYKEKGIVNAFLEIDETQMSDRGHYFCSAHNTANEYVNATESSTFIRVKDKLAALWPFIGICTEVIVLCAVIFVYERKRNKSELEESDTDQSPEQKNTPDHGKESVRQRK